MPLEAPTRSLGPACVRGAVEARFPREQAIKLRGRRGAPGAPRLVLGPAGRRRQGGVREGVTASPTSSAFAPRLSFWCQLRGKCERVNLLEGGISRTACTPVSRAEADPPDLGTLGFHLDT